MADQSTRPEGKDGTHINLSNDAEVGFWTKELNISREQLEAIVKTVGTSVSAVRGEIATE